MPPSPPPSPLTLARNFATALLHPTNPDTTNTNTTYDHRILQHMLITSATLSPTPTVTTRLTVTPELCNALGTLHGGAIATVFDLCTTLPIALLRRPLPGREEEEEEDGDGVEGGEIFWQAAGVSRTLTLSYLAPVFSGEEIEVVAEILSLGARMAVVRGVMRKVEGGKGGMGGKVVATAEHGKVNIDRRGSGVGVRGKGGKGAGGRSKL